MVRFLKSEEVIAKEIKEFYCGLIGTASANRKGVNLPVVRKGP